MASFAEEDDFDSDTSDEDYVPCGEGEAVSEEEHSGEDEDFLAGDEDSKLVTGKRRKGKGKRKNQSENLVRKRTGGIKLEEEKSENQNAEDKVAEETDSYNKELAAQIEKEKASKKEAEEKNKADSLWADFMSDVGSPKPKPKATSGSLGSLSSLSKPTASPSTAKTATPSSVSSPVAAAAASSSPSAASSKVTITKEYDFAGETVKISKEVDANSKEAKAEMKKQEKQEEKPNLLSGPNLSGLKRPGGGLGSVLGKIGKKPKMSTLEKSKLDWNSFKEKEGIEEELQIHNRGKSGYIERKEFLERTDVRQFERERDIRLKMMNSKR